MRGFGNDFQVADLFNHEGVSKESSVPSPAQGSFATELCPLNKSRTWRALLQKKSKVHVKDDSFEMP